MRDSEMDGGEEMMKGVNIEKVRQSWLPGVKLLGSTILFSPQSCRRPVRGTGGEDSRGCDDTHTLYCILIEVIHFLCFFCKTTKVNL